MLQTSHFSDMDGFYPKRSAKKQNISCCVSAANQEFERFLEDEQLQAYLAHFNVDVDSAWQAQHGWASPSPHVIRFFVVPGFTIDTLDFETC
jgi:hypothetical protein